MTHNFLSFSKDAAKTLGLSEAVMLEVKDSSADKKDFEERTESLIGKNWEPDAALIDQASGYGISKSFVLSQLDDFIHLHREKSDTSYSWGTLVILGVSNF